MANTIVVMMVRRNAAMSIEGANNPQELWTGNGKFFSKNELIRKLMIESIELVQARAADAIHRTRIDALIEEQKKYHSNFSPAPTMYSRIKFQPRKKINLSFVRLSFNQPVIKAANSPIMT